MSTKETWLKLRACLDITSAICGVITFLITFFADVVAAHNVQNKLIDVILQYKITIILCVAGLIILRYIICVIPRFRVIVEEVPQQETKPSLMLVVIVAVVFTVLISNSLNTSSINANHTSDTNETETTENIEDTAIENESRQVDEEQSAIIRITEDELIEKYIIMSESEVISEDILKDLSDKELYYIRNGIFAYEGLLFESGYYERFSWYEGDTYSEEEIWNRFNKYQSSNVKNIISLEKERNLH